MSSRKPAKPAGGCREIFLELRSTGVDAETIRKYRAAVDPFIENCGKKYVEEVTRQDTIDFMGWLRKQPVSGNAISALTAAPMICCFPTAGESPTSIWFGHSRILPSGLERNSTPSFTSCARPEPLGAMLPTPWLDYTHT
jgi:hypothetical protein